MMYVSFGLRSCTCILLIGAITSVLGTMCDLCDCIAGNPGLSGGIANVQVRCKEGTVTWHLANGAVRLTLGSENIGWTRICVRVESDVPIAVFRESSNVIQRNYRTKNSGHIETKLSPLFTSQGHGKEHCISASGSVNLYLQTEPSPVVAAKVKIHYDVEKVNSDYDPHSIEECRPCTDRELLRAVCSSDFVAYGKIDDVTNEDDASIIRVTASRVISQIGEIFTPQHRKPDRNESKRLSKTSFHQSKTIFRNERTRPNELKGVVHAPLKCGIRHGEGQFMFTGRVRLGQPVLQCAPRYQQWKHVLEKARAESLLECSLDL